MSGTGLEPRWASAPGATIASALAERDVTSETFAAQVGLAGDDVERLLAGDLRITVELARKLAEVVGASATFWLTREAQYLEDRARVDADHWAQDLPVTQMTSFGWVDKPHDWRERIAICFDFFGINGVDDWEHRYARKVAAIHFRTSPTFDLDSTATTVWFRAAERQVDSRPPIPAFDRDGFAASLESVKKLTRQRDPQTFLPRLQEACVSHGVHLVVLPAPKGCPASGASRIYLDRPLIQLSARFLSDDQFWFTFFHEAGHVVSHDLDDGFIDVMDDEGADSLEDEANEFAHECLWGPGPHQGRAPQRWSHREVIRTAHELGIAPGILVGQLQHSGALPKSHLNGLKRRYAWVGSELRVAGRGESN